MTGYQPWHSIMNAVPHTVDCNYPTEHTQHHHEHLKTGRLVCYICHPPHYLLSEREAA